jgi:hypothetical protein
MVPGPQRSGFSDPLAILRSLGAAAAMLLICKPWSW